MLAEAEKALGLKINLETIGLNDLVSQIMVDEIGVIPGDIGGVSGSGPGRSRAKCHPLGQTLGHTVGRCRPSPSSICGRGEGTKSRLTARRSTSIRNAARPVKRGHAPRHYIHAHGSGPGNGRGRDSHKTSITRGTSCKSPLQRTPGRDFPAGLPEVFACHLPHCPVIRGYHARERHIPEVRYRDEIWPWKR